MRSPILVITILLYVFCMYGCRNQSDRQTGSFERVDGTKTETLSFEVAYTQSMRSLGLMYRRSLGQNEGMLFLFPDVAPRQFWMKNTPLPLDIIFLDAELKIVSIAKNTVPYSESQIPSEYPSSYVLELNAGRTTELSLSKGAKLIVTGTLPIPK